MKVNLGTIEITDWERQLMNRDRGKPGKMKRTDVRDRCHIILKQYFARLGAVAQVQAGQTGTAKEKKARFQSYMDEFYGWPE